MFGDPLERIWRDCIFGLCGIRHLERRTFSVMVTSSDETRKAWLRQVRDLVERTWPRTVASRGLS